MVPEHRPRWADPERQSVLNYFKELWPRVENWAGTRLLIYVEACEARGAPPWAAKEALRDLRISWEKESPPWPAMVADKALDNFRREVASREPMGYKTMDSDPEMKPEAFHNLEDWWGPRVNHPNKIMREHYRKIRQQVESGEVPMTREPGEEG